MNFYKDKYLKYKNKYNYLKTQVGSAPTNILYHGTSFYFINSIMEKGLGEFPEDLFRDIEFAYNEITDPEFIRKNGNYIYDGYTRAFIFRQQNYILSKKVALSFTGKFRIATEYSEGARHGGEGLSRLLTALNSIDDEKLTEKTKTIKERLNVINLYPGIILAIKIDELKTYSNDRVFNRMNYDDEDYEDVLEFIIPPKYLYIVKDDRTLISLVDDEKNCEYIEHLNNIFKERIKNHYRYIAEQKLKLKKMETSWNKNITNTTDNYYIYYQNSRWDISIRNGDKTSGYPEYFQINIYNINDNIRINYIIKDDKDNIDISNNNTGNDNISFINSDYLNEIKLLIQELIIKILDMSSKKEYYLLKIQKYFKWI